MSTRSIFRLAAATLIAAFGLAAGPAAAVSLTCSAGGPGNSGASFTLGPAADRACFDGNDTNTIDSGFSMFGKTGWILADKNDDAKSGDQVITFTTAPINDSKSGNWAISGFAEHVVITLKGGSGFGAFLLEAGKLAGTWSSSKDLSHASIYYTGTAAPIPLPAAAWLLLGGLGALAAASRRKRPA